MWCGNAKDHDILARKHINRYTIRAANRRTIIPEGVNTIPSNLPILIFDKIALLLNACVYAATGMDRAFRSQQLIQLLQA